MVRLIIIFFFLGFSCFAQTDITQNPLDKSASVDKNVPFDTTRGKRFKRAMKNTGQTLAKVIGIDTFTVQERPKITLLRALFCPIPGTGQIMNRDFAKLPIIYFGAGFGISMLFENNGRYHEFRDIVREMNKNGEISRPYEDGGASISVETYARTASQYRRYREFTIIGLGLGWALVAVEANVSAHLKNFDISDNISMKWSPTFIPMGGTYTAGVKFSLNFK